MKIGIFKKSFQGQFEVQTATLAIFFMDFSGVIVMTYIHGFFKTMFMDYQKKKKKLRYICQVSINSYLKIIFKSLLTLIS